MAYTPLDTVGATDSIQAGGNKINAMFLELYAKVTSLSADGLTASFQSYKLAAVSATLPALTLVDYCEFDNSKNPAWIDQCSDKSWYNETVYTGKQFLAAGYANDAAALAANPTIVANDIYYNTTSGGFVLYTTGTTIYRAGSRKFPLRGVATAEAGRVIIWDTTSGSPTMWMVFTKGGLTWATSNVLVNYGTSFSVKFSEGRLVVGNDSHGCYVIDFANDGASHYGAAANQGNGVYLSGLSNRNAANGYNDFRSAYIVNVVVNSVAITYLPDAPLDSFGMRVPTIAVATAGGVSVIKHDGAVVNATGAVSLISCDIDKNGRTLFASTSKVYVYNSVPTASTTLAAADYIFDTAGTSGPHIDGTIASVRWAGNSIVVATSTGLFTIQYNQTTPASSLLSKKALTFETGVQVGDIRRAIGYDSASTLADKSVKASAGLTVTGAPTITPQAGGRTKVSFAGNATINDANHADWNAMGTTRYIKYVGVTWGTAGTVRVLDAVGDGTTAGDYILSMDATNKLTMATHNGTAFATRLQSAAMTDAAAHVVEIIANGTTLIFRIDGIQVASVADTTNYNTAKARNVGNNAAGTAPWTGAFEGYGHLSATIPTAEQSNFIAAQENALNGGAACLLLEAAVTRLGVKESSGIIECDTATYRHFIKGLKRVDYLTLSTGVLASGGVMPHASLFFTGTTIRYRAPERDLNSEIKALNMSLAEANQRPVFKQIAADSTGKLSLPQGFKAVRVNSTAGTYVSLVTTPLAFDGFIWSISGLTASTNYDCELVRA